MSVRKLLVIDRARDAVEGLGPQIRSDDVIMAFADTVAQASELLKTELYDAVVYDLSADNSSLPDLVTLLQEAPHKPGLILIADAGSRVMVDAKEQALAYSLDVLGTLSRPLDLASFLGTLSGIASTGTDADSTVLAESEFLRGLVSDGLSPIFQPKLDLKAGKLVEAEVFARWRAPSGGLLGAGAIIKLAKMQGHMDVLTYRMLELALAQQERWQQEGQSLTVSVNIASENLYRDDFFDVVDGLIDQYDVTPDILRLEITESELDASGHKPIELLEKLKGRGFQLSLDDFGTGFATLLDLSSIPFDDIIIDRRFVGNAVQNDKARIILESAISLAKKLGMRVTCEGVETNEQMTLVKELGADLAQGYLIGKPMSSDEFLIWAEDFDAGVQLVPGVD